MCKMKKSCSYSDIYNIQREAAEHPSPTIFGSGDDRSTLPHLWKLKKSSSDSDICNIQTGAAGYPPCSVSDVFNHHSALEVTVLDSTCTSIPHYSVHQEPQRSSAERWVGLPGIFHQSPTCTFLGFAPFTGSGTHVQSGSSVLEEESRQEQVNGSPDLQDFVLGTDTQSGQKLYLSSSEMDETELDPDFCFNQLDNDVFPADLNDEFDKMMVDTSPVSQPPRLKQDGLATSTDSKVRPSEPKPVIDLADIKIKNFAHYLEIRPFLEIPEPIIVRKHKDMIDDTDDDIMSDAELIEIECTSVTDPNIDDVTLKHGRHSYIEEDDEEDVYMPEQRVTSKTDRYRKRKTGPKQNNDTGELNLTFVERRRNKGDIISCIKCSFSSTSLTHHMQAHCPISKTGGTRKPFKCVDCDLYYLMFVHAEDHVNNPRLSASAHHIVKLIPSVGNSDCTSPATDSWEEVCLGSCDICGFTTMSKNLDRHKLNHVRGKLENYECTDCKVYFSQVDQLIRHKNKRHMLVPVGGKTVNLKPTKTKVTRALKSDTPKEIKSEEIDSDCTSGQDKQIGSNKHTRNKLSIKRESIKKFTCKKCDKVFSSRHRASLHKAKFHVKSKRPDTSDYARPTIMKTDIRKHATKQETFPCGKCGYRSGKSGISRHMLAHKPVSCRGEKQKPFKCVECDLYYLNIGHVEDHLNDPRFPPSTHTIAVLEREQGNDSLKETWTAVDDFKACDICGFVTKRKHLARHKRRHKPDEERQIECTHCKLFFAEEGGLIRHNKFRHSVLENGQSVSNYVKRETIKQEEDTSENGMVVKSEVIKQEGGDTETKNRKPTVEFMAKHESRNKYKCKICKKNFSSRGKATIHKKMCPRRPGMQGDSDVTLRAQRHTKKRASKRCTPKTSNKCAICGLRVGKGIQKHNLGHQELCHNTGMIKPYKCEKCVMFFLKKNSLTLHRELRHGASPTPDAAHPTPHIYPTNPETHQCDVCRKLFQSLDSLKLHRSCHERLNRKTGEDKRYACKRCSMYFTELRVYKHHRNKYHSKQPTSSSSKKLKVDKLQSLSRGATASRRRDNRPITGDDIPANPRDMGMSALEPDTCDNLPDSVKREIPDMPQQLKTVRYSQAIMKCEPLRCELCSSHFSQIEHYTKHVEKHHSTKDEFDINDNTVEADIVVT